MIVVDAPAYAQDPNGKIFWNLLHKINFSNLLIAIIDNGLEIVNLDKITNSNGNILFSLHTLNKWKAACKFFFN